MAPRNRRCLVVSDSRFGSIDPSPVEGWDIELWTLPGLQIEGLIQLANEKLSKKTDQLVLVGLQCDLTYRVQREDDSLGLCRSHVYPPMDWLFNKIVSYTYHWERTSKLSVLWTLPHKMDMVKYNTKLIWQVYELEYLNAVQKEEAVRDSEVFDENLEKLTEKFREKNIDLFDLGRTH